MKEMIRNAIDIMFHMTEEQQQQTNKKTNEQKYLLIKEVMGP